MRVSLQAVSCISTTVKPAQLFSEASTRQRVQIPFMIRSSQAFVLTLEEKTHRNSARAEFKLKLKCSVRAEIIQKLHLSDRGACVRRAAAAGNTGFSKDNLIPQNIKLSQTFAPKAASLTLR